jgi:RecA/RadA recombinase
MQRGTASLSQQMKRHSNTKEVDKAFEGNFSMVTSSGSTLLDLAISSNRVRGGGFPSGIVVEAFGPSQSGKTALLCETAGGIERNGGDNQFHDPEARLDEEFARLFGMTLSKKNYYRPDLVPEVFEKVRLWKPDIKVVNGIFADSLAALSTEMEMDKDEGDKMGGRRAKEFSEQLRKTCRILKNNNYLMVCSNQIRENMGGFGEKYCTPGGHAMEFYSTVRLKFGWPAKIPKEKTIANKKVERIIGIKTEIEVVKTADVPYRKAPIYIIYGYGIDDIRANLQYIKDHTKNTVYQVGSEILSNSMDDSIKYVEEDKLQQKLKDEVIELWNFIEKKFSSNRTKIRI